MKEYLPNFFSVEQATDLVRIGKKYDGGYLVSQSDIEKSERHKEQNTPNCTNRLVER